MSDEVRLVAAALAGDEDAFTALYEAHAGYVQAVGRSILRTEELEDMCQETFLLAFTRLRGYAGNAGFRTWITRIAINQCLMMLRRRQQGSNGDCRLMQMDFEAAEDDVFFSTRDVYLENVPARVDAEKLLQGLKPMQRQILEMAYLEERSDAEIVDALGITLSALSNTLYRLKRRLRKSQSIVASTEHR